MEKLNISTTKTQEEKRLIELHGGYKAKTLFYLRDGINDCLKSLPEELKNIFQNRLFEKLFEGSTILKLEYQKYFSIESTVNITTNMSYLYKSYHLSSDEYIEFNSMYKGYGGCLRLDDDYIAVPVEMYSNVQEKFPLIMRDLLVVDSYMKINGKEYKVVKKSGSDSLKTIYYESVQVILVTGIMIHNCIVCQDIGDMVCNFKVSPTTGRVNSSTSKATEGLWEILIGETVVGTEMSLSEGLQKLINERSQ